MRNWLLALSLGAAACRGGTPDGGRPVVGAPEALSYAPSLGVNLGAMTKTPSGLYYKDLGAGSGLQAGNGNTVRVHYTGWLANGKPFDSSRTNGQPFSFTIGRGMVIPGWDEGVAGMKIGGKRLLVIPPTLGYGDAGAGGVIPPGATLVFEVELLNVL
jgi:FKBP-type peptidyl-prolyl cis-trans isomerase